MSRETLETVGGFDPIFFHYGEDNNYVQRVRYHGLKVGVCPHSKIHHDRENRTRKTVYESRKFAINSMIKYANVNENGPRKMSDKIWKLRLRLVYYLLTLKGSWKITYDKLDTLASIADDVRESWQKNKKSGPHYLDISSVENI